MRIDLTTNKRSVMTFYGHYFASQVSEEMVQWLMANIGPVLLHDQTSRLGTFVSTPGLRGLEFFSPLIKDDTQVVTDYFRDSNSDKLFHWNEIIIGDGWGLHYNLMWDVRKNPGQPIAPYEFFVTMDDEDQALMFKLTFT